MSKSRSNSLSALEERHRKSGEFLEAKRREVAIVLGTPFVKHLGDDLSEKDAGRLAVAVQKIGVKNALERLV